MNTDDEKNVLEILIKLSEQTNCRIEKFTRYLLVLLVLVVLCFSFTICWVVKSNNDTIQECTRLYFETDYLLPETDVTQTQTIGDIK
jgi:hypothetical protein